jgi:hypothetical protein
MDEGILSILLREQQTQGTQLARLTSNVATLEQRLKISAQSERKESLTRWRALRAEVKALAGKIDTQPIAFRQIMDTWWLRLAAILALGAANIDLKQAIALVLQVK